LQPHHYIIIGAAAITLAFSAGWWLRPCAAAPPVYTDAADSLRIEHARADAMMMDAIERVQALRDTLEALRAKPIPSPHDTYRAIHSSGLDSIMQRLDRVPTERR
jgi:hypothetical protein